MQRLMRLNLRPGINPIIVKELRSRMREGRAFVILTVVLLMLGSVSYLIYRMALATGAYSSTPLSPQIGQTLFVALAFLELMIVCAIAPALTAGAISGEQEKLTYEMLLATPLHPASILWGKLVSALSYVLLLIFAAIPMASLIFIFGGVALRDMLKALIILVVVAVTFGILGLFMSAWLKRTGRATVLSFLVVVALVFGTVFIYIAIGVIGQTEPPRWLLVANPVSALFSALSTSLPFEGSPLGYIGFLGLNLGGNVRMLSGATISQTGIPRPLYHYSLPVYAGLALGLYLVSTRLVLPTRRWRLSRRDFLVVLALLLVFAGAVALAFTASAGRYEQASGSAAQNPWLPFFGKGMVMSERAVQVIEAPAVVEPLPPYPEPGGPTPTPIPPPGAEPSSNKGLPVQAYPYPAPGGSPVLPSGDQAAIYAAAIRQLYVEDYFHGDLPDLGKIYLVQQTDDGVGDPDAPRTASGPLPEEIQTLASAALADLGEILWIGNPDQLTFARDNGEIMGGGVIITLGNLHDQEDGTVLVSAALYAGNVAGLGKTYWVEKVETTWQVTGDTGF